MRISQDAKMSIIISALILILLLQFLSFEKDRAQDFAIRHAGYTLKKLEDKFFVYPTEAEIKKQKKLMIYYKKRWNKNYHPIKWGE